MVRQRPLALLVMGICCCAFAAMWFLWLALANGGDLLDLLAVAFGNQELRENLAHRNLAAAGPIRFVVTLGAVQAVLLGTLVWTGYALLHIKRSGRWSAVAFSSFAAAAALIHTFVQVFFLTLPGEAVRVGPFLMDAAVILFAIHLGGTMFLPSVIAAYAGNIDKQPLAPH